VYPIFSRSAAHWCDIVKQTTTGTIDCVLDDGTAVRFRLVIPRLDFTNPGVWKPTFVVENLPFPYEVATEPIKYDHNGAPTDSNSWDRARGGKYYLFVPATNVHLALSCVYNLGDEFELTNHLSYLSVKNWTRNAYYFMIGRANA
jgi:hypothetical protein